MVFYRGGADGGIPEKNGGGAGRMAEAAIPGSGAYRFGEAGHAGTKTVRRVSSFASGSGDPEWNGDQGVQPRALFRASAGGEYYKREGDPAGCGREKVYKNFEQVRLIFVS